MQLLQGDRAPAHCSNGIALAMPLVLDLYFYLTRKALAQAAENTQTITPVSVLTYPHPPCRFGWCAKHQPKATGHRLVLGGREEGDLGVGGIGVTRNVSVV